MWIEHWVWKVRLNWGWWIVGVFVMKDCYGIALGPVGVMRTLERIHV